jgi:ABC-type Fe3+/spermidine/putrescine transport system ATPase subunit
VTHDQEEAMAISDRIAVMDKGAVVQLGTARDLYYRPRTEFVARFIGRTNILQARVVSAGEVEIEGQRVQCASGQADGMTIGLVVRPEMVVLRPPRDRPANGKIVKATFLGEKTDYHVAFGTTVLQAVTTGIPDEAMAAGSDVVIEFKADGFHRLESR